jgi:hypothetical protein
VYVVYMCERGGGGGGGSGLRRDLKIRQVPQLKCGALVEKRSRPSDISSVIHT